MDAVDVLKICLRRWYVMLPILLGAVGVSYQLMQAQETTYTAATSYGLVQRGLPAGADATRNPLGPDGDVLVGAALEAQLSSREAQKELGSADTRGWGPGGVKNDSSYSVQIPLNATTYEVRAWGADEQAVREVVNRVVKAAPGIADELQGQVDVPAEMRYEPFILAPTQSEALASTSGKKLVVAVMGVGVLVGAAWSIVADRILRRRVRSNRTPLRERPAPEEEPTASKWPSLVKTPPPSTGPDPSKTSAPSKWPDPSKRPALSRRTAAAKRPAPGAPRGALQKPRTRSLTGDQSSLGR